MIKKLFIAFSLLIFLSLTAISQNYDWVKTGTSVGFDYGNGVIADDSGNVYVAGQFEFDFTVSQAFLSTLGQHDIFICKYGPDGTLKWIKQAGGSDGDAGSALSMDGQGNLYMTGEYETKCYFFPNDSLTVQGANDAFLVKYSNNGNLKWVRRMGGNGDDRGRGIATDANGNSYFTGSFSNTANFQNISFSATGAIDGWFAKYDSSGNVVWAKKFGSSSDDRGRNILLDNTGSFFMTGTFRNNCNLAGTNLNASGRQNSFIAKFDTSGQLNWVRTAWYKDTTRMAGIAQDGSGNIYVTGYFMDTSFFSGSRIVSYGSSDVFLAKYDSTGNLLWVKREGGIYEDIGTGLAFDKNNGILYATGQFDFQANFSGTIVNSNGNREFYVAAYDTAGNLLWIKTGGSTTRDAGNYCAVNSQGNVYATGFTTDTANFGGITTQGYPLADFFVTKLTPGLATQPVNGTSNLSSALNNCSNINLTWTNGSGSNRLVIARQGSAVNALPVDGTSYSANSTFGSGSQIGVGNYVVYNGPASACNLSGFLANNTYHFTVVEYNGSGAFTNYNTTNTATTSRATGNFILTINPSNVAICSGTSTVLRTVGAVSATWSPSSGLSNSNDTVTTASPLITTVYNVIGIDANGCTSNANITVTINTTPTVTLNDLGPLCNNASAVALNFSPSGGTLSGNGLVGQNFNPAASGPGVHQIIYAFTDANNCSSSDTILVVVNNAPTVDAGTYVANCAGSGTVALSGTPAGGTFSGTGVSGNNFNLSQGTIGLNTITYSYTDGNGCSNTDNATIQINALPTVTLSNINDVCEGAPSFALSGGSPSGGSYTINGNAATNFDATALGIGNHTVVYSYTDGNGCSSSATDQVAVITAPTVTFATVPSQCVNGSSITLTQGSPTGGTYSGTGVSGNNFNPSTAGVGTIVLTYNYTAIGGCSGSATRSVTVNALPTVDAGTYVANCAGSGTVALSGTPAGGTFSGTGVSGNNFNLSQGTIGLNTITYSYTDGNGCSNTDNATIQINALPTVTLSNINDVCEGASSFALSGGSPAGGSYTINGNAATNFDATALGIGNHTVVYSYTDGNGCSSSATDQVAVITAPTVTFATVPSQCVNGSSITLTQGSPTGGTYSGTGVSGNNFNPSTAGVGTIVLTYNYTAIGGCSGSATRSVTVNALPTVDAGTYVANCAGSGTVALSGTPAGGTFSGTGVSGNNFNLSQGTIGLNTITYSYTDANGCSNTDNATIQINALPTVTLSNINDVCEGAPSFALSGGSPAGGSYTINGNAATNFDATAMGIGNHTVVYSYTDGNGCSSSATDQVAVITAPTVTFATVPSQCVNGSSITLTQGSPTGGTYSGTGVSGNNFNPSTAGVGTIVLTYNYTAIGGCSGSATRSVTVNALPTVDAGTYVANCAGSGTVALSGTPVGGTFSGTGVSGNNFNLSQGTIGLNTITYSYTDGNGCSNTDNATIQINALPTVTLSNINDVCEGAPSFALSGGSPSGGSYTINGNAATNFDATALGIGNHTVVYSYTDGNGCSSSATDQVAVITAPTVTFATVPSQCVNGSSITLTQGSPTGGTYSGTGVSGNNFNPSTAGVGTIVLTYNYTAIGGCSGSATRSVTVNALPTVDAGTYVANCAGSGTVALSGTPAGGTFSGTGVSGNNFNLSQGTIGLNTITYSYTDGNGCSNTDNATIQINALPTVTLSNINDVCEGVPSFALSGGSPAGGSYTINGNAATNFDATALGIGNHTVVYSYTDGNGCSSSATDQVAVKVSPVVTFGPIPDLCSNNSNVALTQGMPVGGTYSGTGVSGNAFTPTLGAGNYNLSYTYTATNGCVNAANQTVTVYQAPTINLGLDTLLCIQNTITLNAGFGFNSYLWNTGATSQTLLVDSNNASSSGTLFSVTVTDAKNCNATDEILVTLDVCTGFSNSNLPRGIEIYPNPVADLLTVNYLSKDEAILKAFDAAGRLVFSTQLQYGTTNVITENWAVGVYHLQIQSAKKNISYQLVKTH